MTRSRDRDVSSPTSDAAAGQHWPERAAERSLRRSRSQSIKQASVIVAAAQRLLLEHGRAFTTQELIKEAGIALQTFYRYFSSKDELLLAVLEAGTARTCDMLRTQAADLASPVDRLRHYVTAIVNRAFDPEDLAGPYNRFITSEHYRLHQLFPDELTAISDARYSGLLMPAIREAAESGELATTDIGRDARLVAQLVVSTFHYYAFATHTDSPEDVADGVWEFCFKALGGGATIRPPASAPRKSPRTRNPGRVS